MSQNYLYTLCRLWEVDEAELATREQQAKALWRIWEPMSKPYLLRHYGISEHIYRQVKKLAGATEAERGDLVGAHA